MAIRATGLIHEGSASRLPLQVTVVTWGSMVTTAGQRLRLYCVPAVSPDEVPCDLCACVAIQCTQTTDPQLFSRGTQLRARRSPPSRSARRRERETMRPRTCSAPRTNGSRPLSEHCASGPRWRLEHLLTGSNYAVITRMARKFSC
eukprot:scaffold75351_cov58-Phaeocystis_antarctica.AAC.3